jgi:endonuclease/exonuclease/phosphatase family metal-dependent hydrolase
VKIVTWNLGYRQHRHYHDEAWVFLCDELRPDLVLLQEAKPPPWNPKHGILLEELTHGSGTAIYAPSLSLSRKPFSAYPGRVASALIDIGSETRLFVASVHAPIIGGRVFPHLAGILTALEAMRGSRGAIVGGDLNSARLSEVVRPGCGHGPFWDRIDRGDPWVDCCRRFHQREVQTLFGERAVHPFQADHVFVSRSLGGRVTACDVVDTELTRRVSDHIPIVVELDL